jgi:hypothetical protein
MCWYNKTFKNHVYCTLNINININININPLNTADAVCRVEINI